MSLVPCPACTRPLSAAAVSCPACGHPMQVAGGPYAAQGTGSSKNWTKIAGIAGATWAVTDVVRMVVAVVFFLGLFGYLATR
ncbi:MAG: hypothetical protein ACRCYX_11865 [Dermatophilaceae bacterium]